MLSYCSRGAWTAGHGIEVITVFERSVVDSIAHGKVFQQYNM